MTPTVLDHLVASLRQRSGPPEGQESPAAILWPDPKEEWRALLPALREKAPELLALGDYDPDAGVGPAIWLRCVVDGTLPAPFSSTDGSRKLAEPADGDGDHAPQPLADEGRPIPILYLPGVAREQLRAGADCPEHLKPLVELIYRGALWIHPNNRAWTPTAFLRSAKGPLKLDIATDADTQQALVRALPEVALLPVPSLQGRRWDAEDFNRLLAPDVKRDVLRWMADADGAKDRMGADPWRAFCDRCCQELGLDPETDADVDAAAKLVEGMNGWAGVWERFAEAPDMHGGVVEVLRRSRPSGEIPVNNFDRWPDWNDEKETGARQKIEEAAKLSAKEARAVVAELEDDHGLRRQWLWASLGESPVAQVLEPLARLAEATENAIGGTTPEEAASIYAETGWQADAAAREALACAAHQDKAMVAGVVRLLLEPWLDKTARAFQRAVEGSSQLGTEDRAPVEAAEGECIVFVDGLRYEMGRRLAERLERNGCLVEVRHRWAALPTVTATAKPAVTPVANQVAGDMLGPDFRPMIGPALPATDPARPADAARLREAMAERDYQVVRSDTPEMPLEASARGWMETGRIDKLGHDHHDDASGFARAVEDELDRIVHRVAGLLEVGWESVRIVTDHGWLWLPGGLPMVTLPKHLVASKWARCAVVSGESRPADVLRIPWRWNADQWFAAPPGIACFSKRDAYAHGGVSLQECLTPDIRVESDGAPGGVSASIRSISWLRLRCNALIETTGEGLVADLRIGGPSGESVAAAPKPVAHDGTVSLILSDDEHEDAALTLVVADADGRVLAHRPTRTGAPQ